MEGRLIKYVFVMMAWFLVGTCFNANAQSSRRQAIWTSTSSYRTKSYRPEFHSTSSYISNGTLTARPQITTNISNGIATLGSAPVNRPRRTSEWDEDDEGDPSGDGIGVVPNPAPVGEPFILLLMLALYLLCHIYKTVVKDDQVR